MNCGYLIFTNEKFLPLADILVDSLLEFSKYPIEIICNGFNYERRHERLIHKRVNGVGDAFSDVCFYKNLFMATKTSFDKCVVLDADMVANYNVDDLMDIAIENNRPYTLHAGHGCDPNNQDSAMEYLGVKAKSMPYVYSTYFSCRESIPFLEECWSISQRMKTMKIIPPNTGENILNCMLWKHNVKEQVNCWLPYIDVFPYYITQGMKENPLAGYYGGKELSYHVWHGQKDPAMANGMFTLLKEQDVGNPLLSIKPQIMRTK